ncbi:MAG: UPF0716 protein FxsA [Alphaproteobacteria bacterium]|jgi:UPF0716 protein FxsA
MLPLFLLFVVLPIAEIMLLINVSDNIGSLNTFFIVIVTAAFGAYFVRQQGFSLLQQIQTKLSAGSAPSNEMAEAALLLVAGVLLITPGFITDVLGFLFTLPFSRAPIAGFLMRKIPIKKAGSAHFTQSGFGQQPPNVPFDDFKTEGRNSDDGEIIDGEFTDKSENDDKNRIN